MIIFIKHFYDGFLNSIVRHILEIEDYFCFPKNVRASEYALFMLSALCFLWLVLFDVTSSSAIFQYMYSEKVWASIFGSFSVLHFFGVWIPALQLRQLAVTGYAVVWFLWLILAVYASYASLSVPFFFVAAVMSIYVAVRVSRRVDEE